jgi:hypothetical protein
MYITSSIDSIIVCYCMCVQERLYRAAVVHAAYVSLFSFMSLFIPSFFLSYKLLFGITESRSLHVE